jgi:hypothetical protein
VPEAGNPGWHYPEYVSWVRMWGGSIAVASILQAAVALVVGVITMIAVYVAVLRRGASDRAERANTYTGSDGAIVFRTAKELLTSRGLCRMEIVAAAAKFGISTSPRSCHSKSSADV